MNKAVAQIFELTVYDMYVQQWLRDHISNERMLKTHREYLKSILNGDFPEDYTFSQYIYEMGYDYETYACLDEFLDTEFEDEEYMHDLLKEPELIEAYKAYKTSTEET